ncbi:NAD/NADP octopine/nopaline dehydrogenase family protein [Corallincola holothuriorum]|nr:NAD/NADP octopine/nopaline dehydrogenase family protein [Corallincola holothuriorum]
MQQIAYDTKNSQSLVITVIGGGNAAHALAALLPYKGITTRLWAPFADEAQQLNQGLNEQGYIHAEFAEHNPIHGAIQGRPQIVSANAAEVIPGSDIVLVPLPSFAYRDLFSQIKPYLKPGMMIGVSPGQGGVDWVAREILGSLYDEVVLFAIMPMPFNCRISEYGKRVEVQELKRAYRVACHPESASDRVCTLNNLFFGQSEPCGNLLTASLYPINAVIHPARLYQLAKDYEDNQPLQANPLFYEQMTDEATALMDSVNQELLAIAAALKQAHIPCGELPHIADFLANYVYQEPSQCLTSFFRDNPAYKGFGTPFIPIEGGWRPDFSNRYFTEDIPLGLCLYRGLAELAAVATPTIDKIIEWAQTHMEKSYLVEGQLIGKDIKETHAPQRFGINTLTKLREFYT